MSGRTIHTVEANASQFNSAFQAATVTINNYGGAARKAAADTKELGKASTSGLRGFLELSRGAEDAAVSFGTGGWSGALRGSINNLTQFASIVGGPLAGGLAGMAAAAAASAMAFYKIGQAAVDAKAKVIDLFEAQIKAAGERAGQQQQLGDLDSLKRAKSLLDTEEKRLATLRASEDKVRHIVTLRQQAVQAEKDLKRWEETGGRPNLGSGFGGILGEAFPFLMPGREANINLSPEKMAKIHNKLNEETKAREAQEEKIAGIRARYREMELEAEKAMIEEGTTEANKAANEMAATERKLIERLDKERQEMIGNIEKKERDALTRRMISLAQRGENMKLSPFKAPEATGGSDSSAWQKILNNAAVTGKTPERNIEELTKKLIKTVEKEAREMAEIKRILKEKLDFAIFQ